MATIQISNALLPSEPQFGRVIPDSWYVKRESNTSDGPVVDMDKLIRIIAEHPDGGLIYVEIGPDASTELKRMDLDALRAWQLLPTPLTKKTLAGKLAALRDRNDFEETSSLYLEALTTIAVYNLSDKEAVELAKGVLEGIYETS